MLASADDGRAARAAGEGFSRVQACCGGEDCGVQTPERRVRASAMNQLERGLSRSWSLRIALLLVVAFLAAGVWPWKEGGADFLGRRDPYG